MRNRKEHALSRTYSGMIQRCRNPNNPRYADYGGRGIMVCERWLEKNPRGTGFKNFLADMGPRPHGFSIERLDVDGHYTPMNCAWANRTQQIRNTRRKRVILIEGKSYHVAELAALHGINMKTIYYRASQGWPIARVLSKQLQYNNTESQKKAVRVHAEKQRAKSHCKRGHPLSGDNLYAYNGMRYCKTCRKAWDRFFYNCRKGKMEHYLYSDPVVKP